tara:strand:+ start:4322 stop:4426 length:105 start_codon:yes stop_codon:yes gene_type:complete
LLDRAGSLSDLDSNEEKEKRIEGIVKEEVYFINF